MSQFKNKIQTLLLSPKINQAQRDIDDNKVRNVCSAEVKVRAYCSNSPRSNLIHQQPIIICKKQNPEKQTKNTIKQRKVAQTDKKAIKKIQPFVPIQIPASPRATKLEKSKITQFLSAINTQTSTPANAKKQIQIHIQKQKDNNSKQCLKKLFKKIHKLTQDLAQSQKQRIRLELELNNLKNIDGVNRGQQKDNMKLQAQNYKLKSDVDYFKELLKDKNAQLNTIKNKVPTQVIKQVVVQKPFQVRVQVPKYVPGPQKIVEIPKYIENKSQQKQIQNLKRKILELQNQLQIQRKRKSQSDIVRVVRQPSLDVPAIVQRPVYLEKPVYIDRPIYIQKPIMTERQKVVEVPIKVPYEVPVYIQKPIMDNQVYAKIDEMGRDLQIYISQNQQLKHEINQLRYYINQLQTCLQILRRHNNQKNHQVQLLLQNTDDYNPLKIKQLIRKETRVINHTENRRNAQIGPTFNTNI